MTERATASAEHIVGRRPATSRARIFDVAMELFATNGFAETSVDDIAAAAGISRRTLFRYYATKADIPWGEFADQIAGMRNHFRDVAPDTPLREALADALVAFNTFPESETATHRQRMQLLLNVDELAAHSVLMYADWREAVAEFVARHRGESVDDLVPTASAHATLGIAVAAYQQWLDLPAEAASQAELHRLLRQAATILA